MMTVFFAGLMDDDPLPGLGPLSPGMKERVIVIGAMILVLLLILGWALLFRSHRLRSARREERRHRRHSLAKNAAKGVAELREYVKAHQRRRRRREHRPRNPTLSETGGLPPVRGADEPPPQNQPH